MKVDLVSSNHCGIGGADVRRHRVSLRGDGPDGAVDYGSALLPLVDAR